MYRYRKCMPRANKHLDDKWVKHCQGLHRRKLKEMRPAIDNKPPPRYIHLEQNLKKQQMDEERYSQIERDNYLLLDKMSYIMTHPQLLDEKYMGPPVTCVHPPPPERLQRRLVQGEVCGRKGNGRARCWQLRLRLRRRQLLAWVHDGPSSCAGELLWRVICNLSVA